MRKKGVGDMMNYKNNKKLCVMLLLISVMVLGFFGTAAANKVDDIKNQIDKIEQDKKDAKADKKETQSELTDNKNSLEKEQEKYKSLIKKVDEYDRQIEGYEKEAGDAEKDFQEKQELLKKRLIYLYKQQGNPYVSAILNSKNITDAMDKTYNLTLVMDYTRDLSNDVKRLKEEIEYKKQITEGKREDIKEDADDKEIDITKLKKKNEQLETKISDQQAREEELEEKDRKLQ